MRVPLSELSPQWLSTGPDREKMGFSWLCFCGHHRQEIWLACPLDRQGSVTATGGHVLHECTGDSFDDISIDWGVECGDLWMFVKRGHVVEG